MVSRFVVLFGFLVVWFLGFLVSRFLGFLVFFCSWCLVLMLLVFSVPPTKRAQNPQAQDANPKSPAQDSSQRSKASDRNQTNSSLTYQ